MYRGLHSSALSKTHGFFAVKNVSGIVPTTTTTTTWAYLSGWWLSPTPLKNDGVRQLG